MNTVAAAHKLSYQLEVAMKRFELGGSKMDIYLDFEENALDPAEHAASDHQVARDMGELGEEDSLNLFNLEFVIMQAYDFIELVDSRPAPEDYLKDLNL